MYWYQILAPENGYNSAAVYVEQQTTWIQVIPQCSFQEVQDPWMSQDAWTGQPMVSDEVSFESTSTYRPVDIPPTEDKYKTRLCVNFAKGGSRNCRYGGLCKFIHPSDSQLYAERFQETEEFAKLKLGHQNEVQRLHVMKKTAASRKEELEMEDMINYKVRQFNLDYPKGLNYYDLHVGLRRVGATIQQITSLPSEPFSFNTIMDKMFFCASCPE
ncbi:hypothetical protein B9Z55_006959 [Caenorhabditis nigoni]|uniref:C3H1-type domain-containing protein n=1 Tax=Caenorhabditis nigoni TaxID=1611254 RepID=A0A2G5V7E3_9PELO|nr:hypothetical protein B9Z55_006959 [Caenorhabditis nigoni]